MDMGTLVKSSAIAIALLAASSAAAGGLLEHSAKAALADVVALPSRVGPLARFTEGFSSRRGIKWLERDEAGMVYACGVAKVEVPSGSPEFIASRNLAYLRAVDQAAGKLKAAGFPDVEKSLCAVCCAERRAAEDPLRFELAVVVKLDRASAEAMSRKGIRASGGVPLRIRAANGAFSSSQLLGERFFYDENGVPCVIAFGQHPVPGRGFRASRRRAVLEARRSAMENLANFAKARGIPFRADAAKVVKEGAGRHPGGDGYAYSAVVWRNGADGDGENAAERDGSFEF